LLAIDFNKTPVNEIPADHILNRVRTSIRESRAGESVNRQKKLWWYAAASILFIAMIGYGTWYSLTLQQVQFITAYGEKREIILPDHSVVQLNANSQLTYKQGWNDEIPREVWLKGEAFFEITHSPGKGNAQFIVHTHDLDVEVLGTVFNVSERRGRTQVVLNSGKVKLTSHQAEQQLMMEPGELAELKKGERQFVKRSVNPIQYSSWASDKLIFDKTSFKEIVALIEDTYGYEVKTTVAELNEVTFTATIPSTDMDVLLSIVSESYDVEVEIVKKDKVILIRKNGN